MKCLIYMPALNEAEHIKQVIENLPRVLPGIDEIEYLVVDDGSKDKTAQYAQESGAVVVSHNRNRGVGAAFHSAVNYALSIGADILVGIDADGQFNPDEIQNLIQPIVQKKADMVIGNRFTSGRPANMSAIKFWGNQQVINIVNTITHNNFHDVSCGFRAYGWEALLRMNIVGEFTYTHETILSLSFHGLNIIEYPVWVKYDTDRKSRVASNILHYALQSSKIILRVLLDYRPIRVFGLFGLICIIIGTLFEVFLMSYYFLAGSFSPYKSTGFIGLGFLVFGLLVLVIALIADMLNRMRVNQDKILYEIKRIRYKK